MNPEAVVDGVGSYVLVEGGIGSGKSTFVRHLQAHLQSQRPERVVQAFYEPVEQNPILPLFLQDMKRWSFSLQVYFLNERFLIHREAAVLRSKGDVAILDRGVWGDVCFAKLAHRLGNMTTEELLVYHRMRQNLLDFLPYPSLVIYLDIPPEQQMERIRRRSRDGETAYKIEYLQGLQEEYQEMLERLSRHTHIHRVGWCDYKDDEVARQVEHTWTTAVRGVHGTWVSRQGL